MRDDLRNIEDVVDGAPDQFDTLRRELAEAKAERDGAVAHAAELAAGLDRTEAAHEQTRTDLARAQAGAATMREALTLARNWIGYNNASGAKPDPLDIIRAALSSDAGKDVLEALRLAKEALEAEEKAVRADESETFDPATYGPLRSRADALRARALEAAGRVLT